MSEFTPTVYPAKISSQCGQPLNDDEQLLESLQQVEQQLPNQLFANYSSCKSIYNADPSSCSGYYYITIANGSFVQVYCDMEGTNCGGEGGWTRVAYINMTQDGATCPVGLNQRSFDNKSYCGNTGPPGCNGTMFPTLVEYSRVCVVRFVDIFIEHLVHLIGTILTLVSLLMIPISMECPSRMGVLHANTFGHMLLDY